jgi:hypothetical protein
MRYRKATVVGLGIGLLLAIAVATTDEIIVARLMSRPMVCPDPACTRAAHVGSAEPTQCLTAFALGFAAAFAWFLRRDSRAIDV